MRHVFNEEDAKLILQIPRNQTRGEDKLAWHFNNDEMYTVRSGYHTYVQCLREDQDQPLSSSQLWKKVWGAPLPNKFKHFIWRVAHDALPTRMNLCRRNITEETVCPVCLEAEEILSIFLKIAPLHNQLDKAKIFKCPIMSRS